MLSSSLIHGIKVDEDVWLELTARKYRNRYHNINDSLREVLGLSLGEKEPVKVYSDEGNHVSISETSKF